MSARFHLPLFPLPDTVLFPGVSMPMYVFEPRYRALLAHVQATGEPFGIVRIQVPSAQSDLPLQERVSRLGTLAHLQEVQAHEDGTSSIRVVGGERFRVEDFDLSHPFLAATAELCPLPEESGKASELARSLLAAMMRLLPDSRTDLQALEGQSPVVLASFAATSLPLAATLQESLLAAGTLEDRLGKLMALLPTSSLLVN